MPENPITPNPQNNENVEGNNIDKMENTNGEQFESDTQRIVRRHLENKDDIITEDDIANVRIGMVPPQFDGATEAPFEGDEAHEGAEDDLLDNTEEISKDKKLDERPITPWDTLDSED